MKKPLANAGIKKEGISNNLATTSSGHLKIAVITQIKDAKVRARARKAAASHVHPKTADRNPGAGQRKAHSKAIRSKDKIPRGLIVQSDRAHKIVAAREAGNRSALLKTGDRSGRRKPMMAIRKANQQQSGLYF